MLCALCRTFTVFSLFRIFMDVLTSIVSSPLCSGCCSFAGAVRIILSYPTAAGRQTSRTMILFTRVILVRHEATTQQTCLRSSVRSMSRDPAEQRRSELRSRDNMNLTYRRMS